MKNSKSEKIVIIDFGNSNTKVAEYNLETKLISEIQIIDNKETETNLKLFFIKLISDFSINNSINNYPIKINIIYSNVTNFDFDNFAKKNLNISELENLTFNSIDIRNKFVELEKSKIIEFSNIFGIGTDRLLGLISNYLSYSTRCITIDFGTAITLNLIDENGKVRGGQIIPGYFTQLESLNLNTDKIKLYSKLIQNSTENSTPFDILINSKISELIGKIGDNTFEAVSWGIINSICGTIANFISINSTNQTKINVIFAGSYSFPFYEYFANNRFSNVDNENLVFHHTNNLNITSIQNIYNLYPQLFD